MKRTDRRRVGRLAWVVLLLVAFGAVGCGARDGDSSDPDPNYYKGKNFQSTGKKR